MSIHVVGAAEHNLRRISVDIPDGVTAVTGVSGSGKSSLVFDTLHHEAARRLAELHRIAPAHTVRQPAKVDLISGIRPAIAVAQNVVNRNPNSTVATASGIHPFLRLLFARFGVRECRECGALVSGDHSVPRGSDATVQAVLVPRARGSHATLLGLLHEDPAIETVLVDGSPHKAGASIDSDAPHRVAIVPAFRRTDAGEQIAAARQMGALVVDVAWSDGSRTSVPLAELCTACGSRIEPLEPQVFHASCPYCGGDGCTTCDQTGNHPLAQSVRFAGYRFRDFLGCSLDEIDRLLRSELRHGPGEKLIGEIAERVDSLRSLGLGYLTLDRPSPSLSRGEAQRLRLAVCLKSRLRLLHVLDEPTIGLHPSDTATLMRALRRLNGPVVLVEHDPEAVAMSDHVVDLGPGGGSDGGAVTFTGTPSGLLGSATATGHAFSATPAEKEPRPPASRWISISGASANNLRGVDVRFPVGRLSVVSGVSGSGKSSLVHEVLAATIADGSPVQCSSIDSAGLACTIVDQSPIGNNPRSNPATYTKLGDLIRDLFSAASGKPRSLFSFNQKEGACPVCNGIGAVEVQMRYLPSVWNRCPECNGRRFLPEVLEHTVRMGDSALSIADVLATPVREIEPLFSDEVASALTPSARRRARRIVQTLVAIGLGYLQLGQPSPTLSGGEAQRVKLTRYLGRTRLDGQLLILDEPTTGLHPANTAQLLAGLHRLVDAGTTIIVVEHNLDLLRAADWIVDLGPGAGPAGGAVVYEGAPDGILSCAESRTGAVLRRGDSATRAVAAPSSPEGDAHAISIRGARANNLRAVDVDIPHGALTVVTGVSGSGKSSLVRDVIEAEGRARYLETLSMYERQGVRTRRGRDMASIEGLGVTVTVDPSRIRFSPRATVGTATDLHRQLAVLLAGIGSGPSLPPEYFFRSTYRAACTHCHGVGSTMVPNPNKLIVRPDLPLCGGAMHSPGFFPKGYLCKPFNGGYDEVQAFASRHGFDPATTPWNEMSEEARQGFLFGEEAEHEVRFESRKGTVRTRRMRFSGFYRWIGNWDLHGTYTDAVPCSECDGSGLRAEPRAVHLGGKSIDQLLALPVDLLSEHLSAQSIPTMLDGRARSEHLQSAYDTAVARLQFLRRTGLSYLTLNRLEGTLSAGEAQRVRLAGLLGSGLAGLTVLLDEPSRGMHPREIGSLVDVLRQLAADGSTVVVVEHDAELVGAADHVIEMGPRAGTLGGNVIFSGRPSELANAPESRIGRWLGDGSPHPGSVASVMNGGSPLRAAPTLVLHGARGNNLRDVDLRVPMGRLVGVCGPSGSGKSTLVVDTLARILAPTRHTTSVASEPVDPEPYDGLEGAPARTIVVDQSRTGLSHPGGFLKLDAPLHALFAASPDALDRGIGPDDLARRCAICGGTGVIRHEMGFLPAITTACEACEGSGRPAEYLGISCRGVRMGDLSGMTLQTVRDAFAGEERIERAVATACELGLGYLTVGQPRSSLSGGEAQRLRIASELRRRRADLYILDEPTVGQSNDDVLLLIACLRRLVDAGRTVLVVEHHPLLLASCDWLVELGPDAADDGGEIVAEGDPATVAQGDTATAAYLRHAIDRLAGGDPSNR